MNSDPQEDRGPWKNSIQRHDRLGRRGIAFVDVGTSGGIQGVRQRGLLHGRRRTVGGRSLRAHPEGARPKSHAGPGTGHFVKLVHNGVEFGMLQAMSPALIAEGQRVFRFDTFGDEQLWTDRLRMHEVVETIEPVTALALGLKVDADALPPGLLDSADLDDPATTVALLKLNAVVGLQATVDANDRVTKLVVTCALCHSTVDDSVAPGIGRRLDGWPNRSLDVGAIIASSPAVPTGAKAVYNSWGPGKYDPRFNIDGLNTPLVLPPAYGLRLIKNETYTGDGPVSYWNATSPSPRWAVRVISPTLA